MSELNQGCCAGHADGAGQAAEHGCCSHEAAGAAGAGAAKPAFVADGVNVAVVGATGQVGRVMCAMLDQRDFPVKSLRLFSSARSAGSVVTWRGQDITVEDVARPAWVVSWELADVGLRRSRPSEQEASP